jgi:hypothetical protein
MENSKYSELEHSLFLDKDAQKSYIKSMYNCGLPMTPEEVLEFIELGKKKK